ncbi:MAG: sigma 54-interacting transcriptional regulator [Thermodesulfobacteriota bacterium]
MDEKIKQLELNVLYDISQVIEQALNLDQTLEAILRILSEYLSMNRATITLKSGERSHLKIRASHGLRPEEKERGVYRSGEGVTGLIFRTAEPFVVPDISKEPLFLNKTGARKIEKGRIAFIGVPIVLHGKPIGVLSVDRLFDEEISFEEDIRFLTILAVLVAQFVSLNHQVQAREQNLIRANLSLKTGLSEKSRNFFGVARSRALADVQQLIRKVASTKASVLLLGESGTGKTLVAQIIHEMSSRAQFPFVKVNCAALPDTLLESELFGFEKGAFTGATESKPGRVEDADCGTIFLDEIGELSLPLQAKLLRFLQDREFERLGSTKTRQVDVRIITATNRDLIKAVNEGSFREDLYYRLNVFPIRIPPLRERREDLHSLTRFFSQNITREYGHSIQFTPHAMDALLEYSWPGNVRELENLLERLAIIFEGKTIGVGDLAPYLSHVSRQEVDPDEREFEPLKEREKKDVMAALQRNNWIQSRAARELGITLRQMGYRVKKFGLDQLVRPKSMVR